MRISLHIIVLLLLVLWPGNDAQALTAQPDSAAIEPLQAIGKDIMCTPQLLAHSTTQLVTPALPAALLFALVGFGCVSFVRDRAKWSAMIISSAMLADPHAVAARLAEAFASPYQVLSPVVECSCLMERDGFSPRPAAQLSYLGLLYRLSGSDKTFKYNSCIFEIATASDSAMRNGLSTQFIDSSQLLLSTNQQFPRGPPRFYLRI